DLAGGRNQQSGEQIHQRRLAGAVRPDDRNDLPLVNRHGDLRKRAEHAKGFADVAGLQQDAHAGLLATSRLSSAAKPAMPCGKAMTISARIAPSANRQYSVSDCN